MAINAAAPKRVVRAPRRLRRLPELDILRGVAIFAVLFLHSYFRMWPEVTEGERLALRVSHLFAHGAVPVFLFISGFLLARDRSPSFGAFVRRRLQRIAVPAAVWMTLALAYEAWRADGLSSALLRRFVLFDIEGQFYIPLRPWRADGGGVSAASHLDARAHPCDSGVVPARPRCRRVVRAAADHR